MSETNFEAIFTSLTAAGVEFVVIGGIAAIVHGSATVTYDVDICYRRSRDNVERLCQALAPLHPSLRDVPSELPFRLDPPTVLAGLNYTLSTDLGPLDLLGEVQPFGSYDQVVAQAEEIDLFGFPTLVLRLEALIQAKRAAGRRKDLAALPELAALLHLQGETHLDP